MGIKMFLAFALISVLWTPILCVHLSTDAYWKMNLGNDVIMPKIVKEALLGMEYDKNFETNTVNEYSQSLSKAIYEIESNNKYESSIGELIKWGKGNKGTKPVSDDSMRYFLEKDLIHPASKIKLHFYRAPKEIKFMPLDVANSIPFSSNKLPEILHLFAVNPKSRIANTIKDTIVSCETKSIKGEQRSCATSLESIVDYAKSRLGKNIKVISTEVDKETEQDYKIENAKKVKNEKHLECHKMVYPYAVFYCHTLRKTDAYEVSLIDDTGKNVKAVAVCHKDTSSFHPDHNAFQQLKVKPGGVPFCHFLNPDAMLWVLK